MKTSPRQLLCNIMLFNKCQHIKSVTQPVSKLKLSHRSIFNKIEYLKFET